MNFTSQIKPKRDSRVYRVAFCLFPSHPPSTVDGRLVRCHCSSRSYPPRWLMSCLVSAAYGPVFYTHRSGAMSGQHLADSAVTTGSSGDHSPVDTKSAISIAKQHSYEQIDHAHFLANDIGTLYLNDRWDLVSILFLFYLANSENRYFHIILSEFVLKWTIYSLSKVWFNFFVYFCLISNRHFKPPRVTR